MHADGLVDSRCRVDKMVAPQNVLGRVTGHGKIIRVGPITEANERACVFLDRNQRQVRKLLAANKVDIGPIKIGEPEDSGEFSFVMRGVVIMFLLF